MTYISFILKSAFSDLLRNKLRTALTSLGILIGVSSVVLLLGFGLGLKEYIRQQFESMGTNNIYVMPGNVLGEGGGMDMRSSFGGVSFDEKDYIDLKKIREVTYVIPFSMKTVKSEANGNTEYSSLYGTSEDVFEGLNLKVEDGIAFDKANVNKRSKVVVLGYKLAKELYNNSQLALDSKIRINDMSFKVIGVLEEKGGGGLGGDQFDMAVYMPYKSAYVFNPDKDFLEMVVTAKDEESVPIVKNKIEEALLKRYEEEDFSVAEQTEFLETISSIFSILNLGLVGIGAISLLVGGVGIMNIMYVSVTERIKEIGIRRAIGATKKDILSQFLAESVVLSLFGGIAGLAVATIVILLIQPYFPAYIDALSMIIAIVVSSFIGIFFGVFPARKAANLSPMDAIRYEWEIYLDIFEFTKSSILFLKISWV